MQRLPDIICLSHLRWGFVFQRPNHLMMECARAGQRVFFVEEPAVADPLRGSTSVETPGLAATIREVAPHLFVVTPHLAAGADAVTAQRDLLVQLYRRYHIEAPVLWFYTPMALEFARERPCALTVYDCMDELSAFRGAPAGLRALEVQLLARADLVFTGGQSLYEAKRRLHRQVHAFPSSVDVGHFGRAREQLPDPPDQLTISRPRIGFFGVIDERIDLELIERVARKNPSWSLVMVGPVVKIDPASLPRLRNIHYLGQKTYDELPAYLAGWQVTMMPFALNESTRFISPTKTLEYLAGHKPVVSTPVQDVVSPYGDQGLVQVAERATFAAAVGRALTGQWTPDVERIDHCLAQTSWEWTWAAMALLMRQTQAAKESRVA